jgi:hypothetical protein
VDETALVIEAEAGMAATDIFFPNPRISERQITSNRPAVSPSKN